MSKRNKTQEALGIRLADILTSLDSSETIDIQTLRTARRSLNRLAPLLSIAGY